METRYWPALNQAAHVEQLVAQSIGGGSLASSLVSFQTQDLASLITRGHNYRVTVDISSAGRFQNARYAVLAVCSDPDVIVTEELSAKTDGVVSLLVFVKTSCAHTWDDYNPLTISVQLDGVGWNGASTALEGLTAVVEEIA